jgi:ABC-type uncharacterized transport system auxiliary subunit
MGFPRTVAVALVLVFGCASCTGLSRPSPKIEHYSLEYAPPSTEGAQLPVAIRVERFSEAPLYDTRQIIYREKAFSREGYFYHRWRAMPADLVTYFLARDLKTSGLFVGVLPYDSRQPAAFSIEGSVDEFLESDEEESWEAVLSFSVTLSAAREPDISKRILFQKSYSATRPCKQKNPRALAEAMSEAMAQLSAEVRKDVYKALEVRSKPEVR